MSTSPRIAIVGAGPAGLTLASLFTKHSIPYTAFDIRPNPSSPNSPTSPFVPSASLDLHEESGLLALKECGLYEAFQRLKSHCSEQNIITNKHGEVKWKDNGMGGNRPEIARNDLTTLLLGSSPPENIEWGHKLLSISNNPKLETRTLTFSHNGQESRHDFDLIIGADGAWSKVRPLLTDIKPQISGMYAIALTITSISTYPSLLALIGDGTFCASGDSKAAMAQRGSLDTARIYLMLQSPSPSYLDDSSLSSLVSSPEKLCNKLLSDPSLFATWGEELKSLIRIAISSPIAPTVYPLHTLPLPSPSTTTPWEHKAGLTLLGDAAHLMTPFAGEGVNMAMADSLSLAKALCSSPRENWDSAIEKHEREMWERVVPFMHESARNMEMIFGDEEAPAKFVGFFEGAFGKEGNLARK